MEKRRQWSGRQLTLQSKRRPHYEWSRWTNHCWKPPEHSYNTDQGRRPFRSCNYKQHQKILSTLKLFSGKVRLSAISKWIKEPHCYLTLMSPSISFYFGYTPINVARLKVIMWRVEYLGQTDPLSTIFFYMTKILWLGFYPMKVSEAQKPLECRPPLWYGHLRPFQHCGRLRSSSPTLWSPCLRLETIRCSNRRPERPKVEASSSPFSDRITEITEYKTFIWDKDCMAYLCTLINYKIRHHFPWIYFFILLVNGIKDR